MTQDNPAARLEALADATATIEGENPGPEQQAAQQQAATEATEAEQGAKDWGMLMFTVGGFVSMIDPRLQKVYSQDRCLTWGQHANLVATKYSLNGMALMPEIALMGCTLGFAVPTFLLLRETMGKLTEATAPANIGTKLAFWWRQRKAAKQAAQQAKAGAASGGA